MIECGGIVDHRGVDRTVLPASAGWAVRRALWRTYRWRQALLKGLVGWIIFSIVLIAGSFSFTRSNGFLLVMVAWSGLLMVPLCALGFTFTLRADRERLARVIRRCRKCDYSLVGSLEAGRCPECALTFSDDLPAPGDHPFEQYDTAPPRLLMRLWIRGSPVSFNAFGPWFPSLRRRRTRSGDPSPVPDKRIEPLMERIFRRSWLTWFLPTMLWMNGVPLLYRRGHPSPVRSNYPEDPWGMATLVFMRFALPILICVGAWYLIRLAQRAEYARFTRPERLLEFLACGRCPACLGDLLGAAPDPADGCRVCPNCGGAWRLREA